MSDTTPTPPTPEQPATPPASTTPPDAATPPAASTPPGATMPPAASVPPPAGSVPPPAGTVPPAPAYGAAPGYAPAAPVKQTLSLTSFIIAIASFIFSFIPFVNFLAFAGGIVAVILGFRAKKNETAAPKWMWMVGIIGGFVAIGFSLIFGLVYLLSVLIPLMAYGSLYSSY